ncbi:hypothetical protein [Streptomyces sp. NPDC048411]|uniref:hypothetical protein n=1 Tax=Streptomyces sp. NPDC048411 TaxID=3157206 RepID=UPI003453329B
MLCATSVFAAVVATGASRTRLASAAVGAAAPDAVQKFLAAGLGPGRPWIRQQGDPGNAGRAPGIRDVRHRTDAGTV